MKNGYPKLYRPTVESSRRRKHELLGKINRRDNVHKAMRGRSLEREMCFDRKRKEVDSRKRISMYIHVYEYMYIVLF